MLNPIDEIKNRLDIVEVIQGYIKLQKAGANYKALCPFHSEKTPSFFVSPARQIWHCFGGCQKGGDIFGFVKEIEGVEFGDALKILAQKAGVELKRQPPELKTERQRLYEICEWATRFFEKQLEASKTGQAAKKYLLERKITKESIKKWRIGYAPDVWQELSDFLVGKGYKREEVERAGLAIKGNEEGNFYDRFRGRIIFPIFDLNSQVIGFGGRIFGDTKRPDGQKEAKYINTPNTLLYDKSRVLYGLDKAKMEIRKKDFCILVEGYTDVIMVSQAGLENVVATSGTALTPYQLKILKRYSENLLTAFDMDIAGDTATKRGIDLAQLQGFNIRVILMPKNQDPADIISKSVKDWEKLISEAKSILEFYFETTFSGAGTAGKFDKKTAAGKKEISKILLPVIKRIPNKIEQAHWIQELAKKLEVKEEKIEEELRKISPITFRTEVVEEKPPTIKSGGRKEMLEERIISLILKSPQTLTIIEENYFNIFSSRTQKILRSFKNKSDQYFLDSRFWDFEPELADFLNYLSLKAEIKPETNPGREIQICLKELRSWEIKNELDEVSKEIKKAEEEKDFKKVNDLIEKFNKLAAKLIEI